MLFPHGDSNSIVGGMLGEFFRKTTGYPLNPPYYAIGFEKDLILCGVVIVNNYTGSCVELHLHAPGCFNRQTIKFVYHYIFNDLKCNLFVVKPRRDNKKLCRIISKLNKKAFLTIIPRYYGATKNDDAIMYIFDKEWARRWIKVDA